MTIQPGTRFGAYEITGAIGAGGMGEVYRGRDTKLNRDVAIKVLPPAFAHDRDRLARFEREAQSLAALNHPHIAQIYGMAELGGDGGHALVMEFADGEDLSVRIARGAIPLAEALAIAIQIAEALETAHDRGIIHRDLKPANIKITESGAVKILDFGLAKALGGDPGGSSSSALSNSPTFTSPAMTQMGVIMGTAAYMAPEQAKGKAVDRRADVWAFGGVLFEMLTGQRAFGGEDVTDVIAAIMRAEPDWTALPADTPSSIRKLLTRCLEKDRAKRLDSMAVARFEMQEALAEPEPHAAAAVAIRPRPFWRRALPYAATALAAALLAGLPVWLARPLPDAPVVRFTFALPDGQALGPAGGLGMALSSDGKRLAYAANRQLFIRELDALQPRLLLPNEAKLSIGSLAFSPDGEGIAFVVGGTLMRMSVAGGTPTSIGAVGQASGLTWTDEGFLYASNNTIMRVPLGGGAPEAALTLADDEFIMRPRLLPGGKAFLFGVAQGTAVDRWDNASIAAQRIGDTSKTIVVPRAADARYLPTGHITYAQGGVIFRAPFDPRTLKVTGPAVPVLEGVARGVGVFFGGAAHYTVSDSGTLAYLPGPKEASSRMQASLVLADAAGKLEALKLPSGAYSEPRTSPDGRLIAFTVDDANESNIWVYDMKRGGSARRLTFGGKEHFPVWSHDSTRIAYQSLRDGDAGIFWQRADGSDVPARLTKADAGTVHVPHAWSRDGSALLFDLKRGETDVTLMMLARGGTAAPFGGVVSTAITSPTFSPDGKWVAYSVRRAGGALSLAYVQPWPATGALYQVSKSEEDGHHVTWSRDGQHVFYTPGPGPVLTRVPVTTSPSFEMGEPTIINRQFANQPPQISRPYDIAADGRFLGVGMPQMLNSPGNVGGTIFIVVNWFEELKSGR